MLDRARHTRRTRRGLSVVRSCPLGGAIFQSLPGNATIVTIATRYGVDGLMVAVGGGDRLPAGDIWGERGVLERYGEPIQTRDPAKMIVGDTPK